MSCPSGSYSPSGEKPAAVFQDWTQHRLITQVSFTAVSIQEIQSVHDPQYVLDIFSGERPNGHGNTESAIAESTRWTVGSMVAAAEDALEYGVACSPSSGFHHASYGSNHGFCTFNGLIVAACRLLANRRVGKVGILDCDWHQGDGTDAIITTLELESQVLHLTSGSHDLPNPRAYHEWLHRSVDTLIQAKVDIVLYQAGADAHRDDPLGGILDEAELAERDRVVFDLFALHEIPVAWNLAGGYQRDAEGTICRVLDIHRNTARQAQAAFENRW
jgi:acetoin utilization deacetylase AcuC-like enzyme